MSPLQKLQLKFKFSPRIWRIVLFGLAFLVVFALGGAVGVDYGASSRGLDLSQFWRVYGLIQSNYVGTIDKTKAAQGATVGLVNSLGDPFSYYLTTSQKEDLNSQLTGQFEGIGAELIEKSQAVTVVSPLDGSPASKAGLKANDIIVKVDGTDVTSLSLDQVVAKIRGPKGSTVTLTVIRPSVQQPIDLKITRDDISVPSVSSKMIGNVAYLKISDFGTDTVDGATKAVTDLATHNPKAIVLDLRDDPGGFLEDVPPIAGLFLPPSVVVKEKNKQGHVDELRSTTIPLMPTTPMYVLVNGGSASAAEILSGALQDYKRGTLIGEKTFGKGSVQDVINLPGNTALRITIALWFTPNGRTINKTGLQPDLKITDAKTDTADPVLDKALELSNK